MTIDDVQAMADKIREATGLPVHIRIGPEGDCITIVSTCISPPRL